MAHLLASLKDYFELEETNIDNWAFKLFYKVSCGLCMVGATIGVASQYFGDPIRCYFREKFLKRKFDCNFLCNASVVTSPASMMRMQRTTVGCTGVTTFRKSIRCIMYIPIDQPVYK